MENFIMWVFSAFWNMISVLTGETVLFINNILVDYDTSLSSFDINLVLFSETPILTTNGYDLALLFFSVFYSLIFIVVVWKIIKKIIKKVTRWEKW